VLAAALLATAGVGLSKLVSRSQAVARQSDQRLAATLIAGNVIERLKAVDGDGDSMADRYESEARLARQSAMEASGYDVRVMVKPMDASSDVSGVHVRVEVTAGDLVRVVMHDWRLKTPASNEDTDREPAVAPEQAE
jgi:activator of HSP90 ATPase